jgi:hypothetical protein
MMIRFERLSWSKMEGFRQVMMGTLPIIAWLPWPVI